MLSAPQPSPRVPAPTSAWSRPSPERRRGDVFIRQHKSVNLRGHRQALAYAHRFKSRPLRSARESHHRAKFLLFRQGWPDGRPGLEGGVDYSAQLVYDSARSSSGDSTGTARIIVVKLLLFCSLSIFLDHLRNFLVYKFSIIGFAWTIHSPAAWYRSRTVRPHSQYVHHTDVGTFERLICATLKRLCRAFCE